MKKDKKIFNYFKIVFVVFILILNTACTNKYNNINLQNKEELEIEEFKSIDIRVEKDSKEGTLKNWIGNYTYYEYVPPNQNFSSEIIIYEENNEYLANLKVNGFQMWIDVIARVVGDEEKISLLFMENNLEGSNLLLNADDLLLSFEMDNKNILTYWGIIEPINIENQVSGKIYFEKIN